MSRFEQASSFKQSFTDAQKAAYRTECKEPKFIKYLGPLGYETAKVCCNKCSHCRWVRRQSAANSVEMELKDSDWALWLTLTIRPDPLRAIDKLDKVIDKSVMQRFQKLCRIHAVRRKGSFVSGACTSWRYIQCGEYGKLKGRAHYHLVVFGKGAQPDWVARAAKQEQDGVLNHQNIHIPEWPHGHVVVSDKVDGGVAFYVSKYMQKGGADQVWYSSSNRYAIGARYIVQLAKKLALTNALPTIDWKVSMPWGTRRRSALVRGAKQRDMLLAFCEQKGCTVLSLVKLAPKALYSSLVRIEWQRRAKEAGFKPGLHTRSRDRVKWQVWAELRQELGLHVGPDTYQGRPQRPLDWRPPVFRGCDNGEARASWERSAAAGAALDATLGAQAA